MDTKQLLKMSQKEITGLKAKYRNWRHRNPRAELSVQYGKKKTNKQEMAELMVRFLQEVVGKNAKETLTTEVKDVSGNTVYDTNVVASFPEICQHFQLPPMGDTTSDTLENYVKLGYCRRKMLPKKQAAAVVAMSMPSAAQYSYSYTAKKTERTEGTTSSSSYAVHQNLAQMEPQEVYN